MASKLDPAAALGPQRVMAEGERGGELQVITKRHSNGADSIRPEHDMLALR